VQRTVLSYVARIDVETEGWRCSMFLECSVQIVKRSRCARLCIGLGDAQFMWSNGMDVL